MKFNEAIEKNNYWYLGPNYTVDFVIVWRGKILMITRGGEFERGTLAMPGGFINSKTKGKNPPINEFVPAEDPEDAAKRELEEETKFKIDPKYLSNIKKVGTYERRWNDQIKYGPQNNIRDIRDNDISWGVTTAFYLKLDDEDEPEVAGSDDATDAKFYPIEEIMASDNIAFDHKQIIQDVLKKGGI